MERPDPTEFVAFMRDSAKRALDNVSDRADDLDKGVRAIVKKWSKLATEEKDALLDVLIASWMETDEAKPKKPAKKR